MRRTFDRIFKTNPIAKDVRTPKYKPRIVKYYVKTIIF